LNLVFIFDFWGTNLQISWVSYSILFKLLLFKVKILNICSAEAMKSD
jgi:hypothetical protein